MYIILIGGSMLCFILILVIITYFIMLCSIKISSITNEIENEFNENL